MASISFGGQNTYSSSSSGGNSGSGSLVDKTEAPTIDFNEIMLLEGDNETVQLIKDNYLESVIFLSNSKFIEFIDNTMVINAPYIDTPEKDYAIELFAVEDGKVISSPSIFTLKVINVVAGDTLAGDISTINNYLGSQVLMPNSFTGQNFVDTTGFILI